MVVEDRLAKNAGAIALTKNYHLGYANVFGKLLGLLKATPESDGKTLLDHTVVVWAGEHVEDKTVPSHADLLVSLANAVGVPDTTFGDPSFLQRPDRTAAWVMFVRSDPPAARVFINGSYVGRTPFAQGYGSAGGKVHVLVQAKGYQSWELKPLMIVSMDQQ